MALADLLERMESGARAIDPDPYQTVVLRLRTVLSEPLPDVVLDAVPSGNPVAGPNRTWSVGGTVRTGRSDRRP